MKTFSFTTLALGLSLALAACGDDGGATTSSTGSGGSTSSSTTSATSTTSTSTGTAGGPAALAVQTKSADPAFAVNAHLVTGETNAILVDSMLFSADASAVVDMIKASGKTRQTVFLTHAHPDHYMGLAVIQAAFPSAKFVTTANVRADFDKSAQGTLAYLKTTPIASMVADTLVTPEVVSGTSLTLDGRQIQIVEAQMPGESEHAAALVLSNPNALIAGDLVYGDVHLYLAECHSPGWLQNLDTVKALGVDTIYPGHGGKTTPAVFTADAQYIQDVVPILDAAATTDEAKTQITAKYPTWAGSALLDLSVGSYFGACKTKTP
jgi:glyoxylase-like metal-dependent hydrolase (beta-lactamase superfamily II)